MSETTIAHLRTLRRRQRDELSALGIATVEELLGRTRSRAGARALAEHLGLSENEFDDVLDEARGFVSSEFLELLEQPVRRHKRGALIPPSTEGRLIRRATPVARRQVRYIPLPMEAIIKNAGEFFEGTSALHRAAERLTRKLDDMGIPFAVAGGFALGAYKYGRVTDDIDILVRKDDWHRFKDAFVGLGYIEVFQGSKAIRDTEERIKIEPLYTGGYPGDGKPKPITFPDPSDPSAVITGDRFPVVTLEKLVELKIAAGMTSPGRQFKDYGDAIELIRKNALPASFVDRLDPYVHETFRDLYRRAQQPDQLDERDVP